ncbi:MAG: DUF547 domain-containing protein [Bacteroidota bacterium]
MKSLYFLVVFLFIQSLSAQQEALTSFENKTDALLSQFVIKGYVDYGAIQKSDDLLNELVSDLANIDNSSFNAPQEQSFYINAYNVLVIDQVVRSYPVSSVKEIAGFFNRTKHTVGGKKLTLDEIEKDILIKKFADSRFHFVLVCGAKDCPKIWNRAYRSENLEEQLVAQSQKALNDPEFLKVSSDKVGLSEIFRWNRFEFGGRKDVINFINQFREEPIDPEINSFYYTYDWTLNDTKFESNSSYSSANNSFRYVTSAAIPKGGIELKIFNNLYSQVTNPPDEPQFRSTFLTTRLSFLYGQSNRFNVGFVTQYRRVLNSTGESSPFDVFQSLEGLNGRQGVTAFGPQIRWAPVKGWTNFSVQSSLTFPIGNELSGGSDTPFLDWSGPVFWTQFFNDKSIGDKFSLFTEIDLLVEDIGGSGRSNRVSTPMTVIFSWFPQKNFTVYGLVNYSPFFVQPYDYFRQFGMGMKYQITRDFEVELLFTDFSNKYLSSNFGQAATYNFGFRYSR